MILSSPEDVVEAQLAMVPLRIFKAWLHGTQVSLGEQDETNKPSLSQLCRVLALITHCIAEPTSIWGFVTRQLPLDVNRRSVFEAWLESLG